MVSVLKKIWTSISAFLPSGETFEERIKRWNNAVMYVEKHKRVGTGHTLDLLREVTNVSKGKKSAVFLIVYSIGGEAPKNDVVFAEYSTTSHLSDLQILLDHINHLSQLSYGQLVLLNWWRLPDGSRAVGSGAVDTFHTIIEAGERFRRGY